uniref:Uncharacterized protein n=1 Tax=Podarcis muralis TaxID=64176 RepID=A0A670K8J1_PODMU
MWFLKTLDLTLIRLGAVTRTTNGSSGLQPWLVGLAAVLGFLGVIFVVSLSQLEWDPKKPSSPTPSAPLSPLTTLFSLQGWRREVDEHRPSVNIVAFVMVCVCVCLCVYFVLF